MIVPDYIDWTISEHKSHHLCNSSSILHKMWGTRPSPQTIYSIGDIDYESHINPKRICIVGSRKMTQYGECVTKHIIQHLKGHAVSTISGLAFGIDAMVHEESIKNNIPTIAFPGSGLHQDVLYPQDHKTLAYDIMQNGGLLISTSPPKTTTKPWIFPQRNTLMAQVADAIIIIECTEDSGTMHTAHAAMKYNIPCYIIPHDIYSRTKTGNNILITTYVGKHQYMYIFNSVEQIIKNIGIQLLSVMETQQQLHQHLRELYTASIIFLKTHFISKNKNICGYEEFVKHPHSPLKNVYLSDISQTALSLISLLQLNKIITYNNQQIIITNLPKLE